ncbi:MAG: hypothetical protein J7L90_00700 [Dehalococcoidia bacterium]|nr:hypothetical protein [Dehalococcoidia bacterium]
MTIKIALFMAGLIIGGVLSIRVYQPLRKKRNEDPQLPFMLGALIRLENNLSPMLTDLMAWLHCPIGTEEQTLGSIHCHTVPWGKENAVVDWLSHPQGGLTITMDRADIPKSLATFHKEMRSLYDEMQRINLFYTKYPNILPSMSSIIDFNTACHQIVSAQTPNSAMVLAAYLEILGCNIAQLLRDIRALQETYSNIKPNWPPPAR